MKNRVIKNVTIIQWEPVNKRYRVEYTKAADGAIQISKIDYYSVSAPTNNPWLPVVYPSQELLDDLGKEIARE